MQILLIANWGIVMTKPKKKDAELPTRIGRVTAVLIAVGALIAAVKPIYETVWPLACKAVPGWCDKASTGGLAIGSTGWIYVGTRVGGIWDVTDRERAEPPLVLRTGGMPREGEIYTVINAVRLRDKSPEMPKDGSRPPMTDQKGIIDANSRLKVDKVVTYDLKNPDSTWVFAHVTLIAAGNE